MNIIDYKGILVVDSRLIAQELGIEHESFMRTIQRYQKEIEQAFETLRFEIGTVKNSSGATNEMKYVLLTEEQAIFLMTLSRNTAQVISCKINLVKAFSEAKKRLEGQKQPQLTEIEVIAAIASQMVEQERRQRQLEARVEAIEETQRLAEEELKTLPPALVGAPELSTRAKLNRVIRNAAQRKNTPHQFLYDRLYLEIRDRLHYDAKTRAKNRGIKPLDCIEQDNLLEQAYAIALNLFGE